MGQGSVILEIGIRGCDRAYIPGTGNQVLLCISFYSGTLVFGHEITDRGHPHGAEFTQGSASGRDSQVTGCHQGGHIRDVGMDVDGRVFLCKCI